MIVYESGGLGDAMAKPAHIDHTIDEYNKDHAAMFAFQQRSVNSRDHGTINGGVEPDSIAQEYQQQSKLDPSVTISLPPGEGAALNAMGAANNGVKATVENGDIKGDPHVTNVLGEKFDILATGRVNVLRYPKVAAQLDVDAFIARVGRCDQTFMTQIDLSGPWVQQLLRTDSHISVAARPGDKEKSFVIKYGGGKWEHMTPPMAWKFPENIDIIILANRHHQWNFLELKTYGLVGKEGVLGGILGGDEHASVSTSYACDGSEVRDAVFVEQFPGAGRPLMFALRDPVLGEHTCGC